MIYVDVASMNHKMCGSKFVGRVNKDTRKKDPQEEIGTTYKRKLSTPATYQKISLNTVVMLQRAASAQRTKIMNDRTVEQSRTIEKRTRTDDHGLQNLRINIHGVQTDAESSQA